MKNMAEKSEIYCRQLLTESKNRGFVRNGGTGIYGQTSIIDVFPVTRNGAEGRLSLRHHGVLKSKDICDHILVQALHFIKIVKKVDKIARKVTINVSNT